MRKSLKRFGIAAGIAAGLASGIALGGGLAAAHARYTLSHCTVPAWQFLFNGQYETPGGGEMGAGDPPLIVCNGTTYVPIRFFADSTDSTIKWHPGPNNTATIIVKVPWGSQTPPTAPPISGTNAS